MKKVKITKVPNMAWGGMVFNQVAPNALPYQTDEEMIRYNNVLQPVDREDANLEAEKKEQVFMPNYDGSSALFEVGGKRHSEGGTPLNLPDNTFVYSDTKAMKIKDPDILKTFGKVPKKGGYTPAKIAKQYDINKYRKILDDPMSDSIQRKTAEEMIGNYNVLLGKLALAQEAKKGFPQGIPFVSEPYMMINKISPEDILPMPEEQDMRAPEQSVQITKYGGAKKVRIKQLPQAQAGFQAPWQNTMDMLNPNNYKLNAKGESEYKPQIQSADANTGQIIPPGSHISETERNKAFDFLKPKDGIAPFMKRQYIGKPIAGKIIGGLLGTGSEDDDMLDLITMENSMTAVPTGKGTFNSLSKDNIPDKNQIALQDPFTYSGKYGGALPHAQLGLQTASDSLYNQLGKIVDYEYARGDEYGQGLDQNSGAPYGNPRFAGKNVSRQQAIDWIAQNTVPQVSPYFKSPTEQAEAADFLYNSGRDPRIYMLDQYLQSIGQKGLPNRSSFNLDSTKPEHASAWKTKKAELDKIWKQHEKSISGLSENDRRILLNKGRDFYYRNINVKPDGSPSDAYYNTWYGRIWNTNDYAPFDAKNPKFVPKKKKYGGDLPKGQFGPQVVSNIPGVVPANPMYHPFNDPLTQNIATYRDPKTLPPANNLMIQNALDQQAQAAAVATSLQNQVDQSAKSNNANNNAASKNKTTGSGDLISFNQQFWDEYNNLGQSGAFVYDLPGINFQDPKERQRRELQSRIGKDPNIYGDLEWNKGQEWADFTRRHQWYLKDHPDFNPTDNAQVKDFQNEYCKRAALYGMKSCYFVEGAGKGVGIDGKFGEHTWSAPGFNDPEQKTTTTKKEGKAQEDIKTAGVNQRPPYTPFEYYPQDVVNLMTAMGNQIPDPETFYTNLAWQAYSPAYIKEDYSPIMEAANIATQGIGAYGSRQSADASYSGIQGKAARQAADHNLQVANLNVGIYNDAEKFNAQTREKNYMYNQMQKQQNFDTEQAYAADRMKAKNEKRANIAALYNQMLTNAVDTYNLNIMNPNFKVLPGTGGMIDLINTDILKPNKDANVSPRLREYEALRADGYSHDEAIDIIGRQSGKASYSQAQQYPYSNPYDYMTGLNYYEG